MDLRSSFKPVELDAPADAATAQTDSTDSPQPRPVVTAFSDPVNAPTESLIAARALVLEALIGKMPKSC